MEVSHSNHFQTDGQQNDSHRMYQSSSMGRYSQMNDTTKNNMLKTHFSKLMGKNQQYINHLKGDCICGKCLCGQCKCPKLMLTTDFKKGQESSYQTEYAQKDRLKGIPLPDHNSVYKGTLPMELQTEQRNNYTNPIDANPVKNLKPEQRVFMIPFSSTSSYKLDYAGLGQAQQLILKPPFHPTVVDIPFSNTSTYSRNFYKKPIPKEEFLLNANRSSFKNPISAELPFIYQSMNHKFYKPFITSKQEQVDLPKPPQQLPNFEGQYMSTTMKEFNEKNANKCPSRVFLNSLYKQKLQGS